MKYQKGWEHEEEATKIIRQNMSDKRFVKKIIKLPCYNTCHVNVEILHARDHFIQCPLCTRAYQYIHGLKPRLIEAGRDFKTNNLPSEVRHVLKK